VRRKRTAEIGFYRLKIFVRHFMLTHRTIPQSRGQKVPGWKSERLADATPVLVLGLCEGTRLRLIWITPC
jgi:hypothetical protein